MFVVKKCIFGSIVLRAVRWDEEYMRPGGLIRGTMSDFLLGGGWVRRCEVQC